MRKFMTKCASALVAVTMLVQSTGLGSTVVFAEENGAAGGTAAEHLIINQVYGAAEKVIHQLEIVFLLSDILRTQDDFLGLVCCL